MDHSDSEHLAPPPGGRPERVNGWQQIFGRSYCGLPLYRPNEEDCLWLRNRRDLVLAQIGWNVEGILCRNCL